MNRDTIFAQATAPGRAGISVIRISGPKSYEVLSKITGKPAQPRYAHVRSISDPESKEVLDEGLVLYFPGPASFTGEDVVELQVHGSRAVVTSILRLLSSFDGLRIAEPGEFTRQALMNGRIDLAQTEGLGDLLSAETSAQQKQALNLMSGKLSKKCNEWKDIILKNLSMITASIDFSDEELPEGILTDLERDISQVISNMRTAVSGHEQAKTLRNGFQVAIVGEPNIGKSTLLNCLAGRDVALTSDVAGTTRDVIEVSVDLDGLPVTFLDTAGIRQTVDHVENLGIARALQKANEADLRVILLDAKSTVHPKGISTTDSDIVVYAKSDLIEDTKPNSISGQTGHGVDQLLALVKTTLADRIATIGLIAHERQFKLVSNSISHLEKARANVIADFDATELIAEELQSALTSLDELVGKFNIESVLDVIFSSFCLGK